MTLLSFLLFGTAAAMDVVVTCASAPKYYTIDGMANRQLSIHAGESINFHFESGCSGHPMQIQRIDGTPYPSNGPITSLATSAATPECLVYLCMAHPSTMTGTISVVGGAPCGAMVSVATTLYNRPIITPRPAPITTTSLYPLPTSIYASGSVSLYTPRLPVCPARACPALLPCVSPAYQRTDTMADGCPGCSYCFTPWAVSLPTILPSVACPMRNCGMFPTCTFPAVLQVDLMNDGCSGCPRCVVPNSPCVGLYCLPCCPLIRVEGQACRNCLSFY
jgi:hypothetical protein